MKALFAKLTYRLTARERNMAQQKDEELFGSKKPCIGDVKKT